MESKTATAVSVKSVCLVANMAEKGGMDGGEKRMNARMCAGCVGDGLVLNGRNDCARRVRTGSVSSGACSQALGYVENGVGGTKVPARDTKYRSTYAVVALPLLACNWTATATANKKETDPHQDCKSATSKTTQGSWGIWRDNKR